MSFVCKLSLKGANFHQQCKPPVTKLRPLHFLKIEDFLFFMNRQLLKVLAELQILGRHFQGKGIKVPYLLSQSEGTAKLLPVAVARPHLHSCVNNLHTK